MKVKKQSEHSYNEKTVKQLKIRNSYGRYLTFIGKTINKYNSSPGYYNPGSPGRQVCNSNITSYGSAGFGGTTNCKTEGYIAPSYAPATPGGTQNREYKYELDCKDMTFDRKGDLARGSAMWGWMNVSKDPTAQAVANKYCPIINTFDLT